jgi:hypothetical protein
LGTAGSDGRTGNLLVGVGLAVLGGCRSKLTILLAVATLGCLRRELTYAIAYATISPLSAKAAKALTIIAATAATKTITNLMHFDNVRTLPFRLLLGAKPGTGLIPRRPYSPENRSI